MGVRRSARAETPPREQHLVRLRHEKLRQHEKSLRALQQGNRQRRCTGKTPLSVPDTF